MNLQKIKKAVGFLINTPFHPQWLMYGKKEKFLSDVSRTLNGTVLDIGSADKSVRKYLNPEVRYIGIDYITADILYGCKPDIYATADKLPIANDSIDAVLLLDVLEHVDKPEECIQEISRVLSENGILIVNVPFIYPIHDAPYDYQRWTIFGLQKLLSKYDFIIKQKNSYGNSLETAGLLLNLALCNTVITLIERRHPGLVLVCLLPILIPIINVLAYLTGILFKSENYMPYRYHLIVTRQSSRIEFQV